MGPPRHPYLAADRLDQGDATFHALVEHSLDPMFVWGDDQIRYVNPAMVKLLGYATREEVIAATFIHPDDQHLVRPYRERRATGAVLAPLQLRWRRQDGGIVHIEMSANPLAFAGRPADLVTARDVTYARRMEEELRQSQKMEAVGQLAGGIAHDFNNVLAVILSNVSFVLEDLGPDHASATDLKEIETAAHRATKLTKQLLAFSRKQHHEPKPIAIDGVVTSMEKMLQTVVGETIQVAIESGTDLGTIVADAGHLEQVIMNLAINARDAMPRKGTLTIRTRNADVPARGRCVVLEVTDTGTGMSAATRAHIFEPFFTTKAVGKGTGLGLAMVFGIVKQNKGWIEVDSELARGSTFRMFFPRVDRKAAARSIPPPLHTYARSSGTILVVEDDDLLRNAIRRQITSWGYTMLEARSGPAALELLRERTGAIDLLLTDLVMPGMDGRALAACILCERPELAVVFMSGYAQHTAATGEAFSGHHFIEKPFSRNSLHDTLRAALAQPELTAGSAQRRIAR